MARRKTNNPLIDNHKTMLVLKVLRNNHLIPLFLLLLSEITSSGTSTRTTGEKWYSLGNYIEEEEGSAYQYHYQYLAGHCVANSQDGIVIAVAFRPALCPIYPVLVYPGW
jgi:hypothetical protein